MNKGTRRMWARRVLRAGWLLAPIMQLPGAAYKFLFGNGDRAFVTVALFFMTIGMTSCVVHVNRVDKVASGQQITEALKGDVCMIEMMPRWQKTVQRALRVGDLEDGKDLCNNQNDKAREMAAQHKALTQFK